MTPTTRITFDGETHILAPGADLIDLMNRVESAAHGDSTFVTFSTPFEEMSVLVGATTRVRIAVDFNTHAEQDVLPHDWS
ncbi:hypothetical protein [Streptomyces sp. AC495_CC817]|uniref:hypothetical protein n=1 Tax=Streptomyces sp. AC495_CC817 TaxID=2823900 RepID=UPI001C253983|nr:hypothetical protein [Streptomyces sp. AC495_CC817]